MTTTCDIPTNVLLVEGTTGTRIYWVEGTVLWGCYMGRSRVKHPGTPVMPTQLPFLYALWHFPVISSSLHNLILCTGCCINTNCYYYYYYFVLLCVLNISQNTTIPPKLWSCCLLKFKHFICPRKIMNSVLRPSSKVNLNYQNANPYKPCTYDSSLLPSTHTHSRSGHWLSQHIWLFWYRDLRQIWKSQSSQNIICLPCSPSSVLPHLNSPLRNAPWFRPLLIFHP